MKQPLIWLVGVGLAMAASAGCGEHLEKKHETLVSPSERGTEAERSLKSPEQDKEPPTDTHP
ncbi:MAG TPA: hypothetical protein VHC22_03065 [Pirellulales bacterium]|nr:hypothetical protein [Pirellulales bacterium]